MAVELLVEGPGWTGIGLEESAGRYPLRGDSAVSRIVDRLLPGGITTTPTRGRTASVRSYTQKLWMRVKRKAAYLPG